jgi:hypothetical protein
MSALDAVLIRAYQDPIELDIAVLDAATAELSALRRRAAAWDRHMAEMARRVREDAAMAEREPRLPK